MSTIEVKMTKDKEMKALFIMCSELKKEVKELRAEVKELREKKDSSGPKAVCEKEKLQDWKPTYVKSKTMSSWVRTDMSLPCRKSRH